MTPSSPRISRRSARMPFKTSIVKSFTLLMPSLSALARGGCVACKTPKSVDVVLQEREVALRQIVELERAAAARALEDRWLERGGEDRGGLHQALFLTVAADAGERR